MVFFNKDYKYCCYCVYSIKSDCDNDIFCSYRGVVSAYDNCRKFKYDILKRKPVRTEISKNYSPDDFKL